MTGERDAELERRARSTLDDEEFDELIAMESGPPKQGHLRTMYQSELERLVVVAVNRTRARLEEYKPEASSNEAVGVMVHELINSLYLDLNRILSSLAIDRRAAARRAIDPECAP